MKKFIRFLTIHFVITWTGTVYSQCWLTDTTKYAPDPTLEQIIAADYLYGNNKKRFNEFAFIQKEYISGALYYFGYKNTVSGNGNVIFKRYDTTWAVIDSVVKSINDIDTSDAMTIMFPGEVKHTWAIGFDITDINDDSVALYHGPMAAGGTGGAMKRKSDGTWISADTTNGPLTIGYRPFILSIKKKEVSTTIQDSTLCFGDSTSVSGQFSGDGYAYHWYPGVLFGDSTSATTFLKPLNTDTIILTVNRFSESCVDSSVIYVSKDLRIDLGTDTMMCFGDTLEIGAHANKGVAPYTYQWNNPAGLGMLNDSIAITRISPWMYPIDGYWDAKVIVSDSFGCTFSDTIRINIIKPPKTGFTFADSGLVYHFQDTTLNADSIRWDFGDTLSGTNTSNDSNPMHTYSDSGTYQVCLISWSQHCRPDTSCMTVNVTVTGINNQVNPRFNIRVFPNPSNGRVNIWSNDTRKHNIVITDISGRKVLENVYSGLFSTDLSHGTYLIQVDGTVRKLIVN